MISGPFFLSNSGYALAWEKLPPLPAPNGGFVAGVDRGKLVISGGTNWKDGAKNWLTKAWAFDPQSLKWTSLPELESPIAYAVSGTQTVSRGEAVLVFGGGSNGRRAVNSVQIREQGGGFEARAAELPDNLVLAAGGVHQNSLVFAGGVPDTSRIGEASKATWSVSVDTLQVTPLKPFPGPPFLLAASAMDASGSLFVFGGCTRDAQTQSVVNLDIAHVFDVARNTWAQLPPLPFSVRGMHAAWIATDRTQAGSPGGPFIYLAGGYRSDIKGFTDEAVIYDIGRGAYRPAPRLPYKGMVTLVVMDGYLYCLGGEDQIRSRTDACYRIAIADLMPSEL